MNKHSTFAVAALLAIVASCGTHKGDAAKIGETNTGSTAAQRPPATLESFDPVDPSVTGQMDMAASNGVAQSEDVGSLARPEVKPLEQSAIDKILARLSPLQVETTDKKDFAVRGRSMPPPKTGETITTTFPPASELTRPNAVAAKPGPLQVLRYAPDGDIPVAPKLSVTFDQPMVEITSHKDTIANGVPVKLTPTPEGQWRWIGSKTLLFEPTTEHMPMATEYSVNIPAGTKSKTEGTLEKEVAFTFRTPTVTLQQYFPSSGPVKLDQPIFLGFDQNINQIDMLEHIEVRAGNRVIPIKMADQKTIDADPTIKSYVDQAVAGRYVVVVPSMEMPYNTSIQVVLTKGAPSAEGPRKTESDQSFYFQTYGPLMVTEHRCGWGNCSPNDAFTFYFNNPLEDSAFDDALVQVSPEFPAMTISQSGGYISVYGEKPGRRKYTVTLKAGLKDIFGQTLGKDETFTFEVSAADPRLTAASGEFIVLDPKAGPQFTFYSINYDAVRLKAWEVQPTDWAQYREYLEDWRYYGKKKKLPPGRKVIDTEIKIKGSPDELVQTNLDLTEVFGKDGLGNAVIELTPARASEGSRMPRPDYIPMVRSWLNATKLGVDVMYDYEEALVWANDLATGAPVNGVEFTLVPTNAKGTTKDNGTAIVPLGNASGTASYVLAKKGDDIAMIPESYSGNYPYKYDPSKTLSWFVFDDRGMYKPKEEVHLKGWVRSVDQRKGGDLSLAAGTTSVKWTAYDAMNNKLSEGTTDTTALGGFDFSFVLPETPNLGYCRVELVATGGDHSGSSFTHSFQIQEFRTPEFEVSVHVPPGPFYANAEASARLDAKYYAGGALPNADVNWSITANASAFTPPNQSKYTFGVWVPWWRSGGMTSSSSYANLSAKTDAAGEHFIKLDFGAAEPPRPMTVSLQGTAMDVNRQAWTGSATMLVHPSEYYVGLRSDRYFVEKGTPLEVFVIASDVDGKVTANRPVKVRAGRVKYSWKGGQYVEEVVDEQSCDFMTTAEEYKCTVQTKEGGTYRISATTTDDSGRLNYTEMTRWVSGGKQPIARTVTMENVDLIPDKDEYRPGETAEILVRSPIVPAEAVMSIRRNGMVEQKRFRMEESTTVVTVPIKSGHVPNVWVSIDLVGQSPRLDAKGEPDESLPTRPSIASGDINLQVPPYERTLDVEVTPAAAKTEPGAQTSVSVKVLDAAGKPVQNAEVAIVVVDEAILSLSGYKMANPVSLFYQQRQAGVNEKHSRLSVELIDPTNFGSNPNVTAVKKPSPKRSRSAKGGSFDKKMKSAEMPAEAAPMEEAMAERMEDSKAAPPSPVLGMVAADELEAGADSAPIAVRSNFNPLAGFFPAVKTDPKGMTTVSVKMPDNLTRYRVMAVAVEGGKRFGHGDSNVTARLPLMVRPSAPRFLNFGDKFELPIVLQNQTDAPLQVSVATRASNLAYTGATGLMVTVPANERVEVRFPATTEEAGRARFQVGASAGAWSDAAEINLPVWTPATSEAFATYGQIDDGVVVQPVKMPGEVWTQFGGLEVTTSSTAMQALTDAFLYLYEYAYECAEQISSRMISVAALRDVLSAFKAEGMPTAAALKSSMNRDIDELVDRQNYDGGFGLWRRGQPSWPYISLHAAHALMRAKLKGYEVPANAIARATSYLTNIENYIPYYYGEYTRLHIIAYALYVRGLNKDWDVAKAREVLRRGGGLEKISFESVGWLLGVFTNGEKTAPELAEIRRFLNNRVTETAGAAHFASSISDGDYLILRSDRSADGVILEALMDDQPNSDLVPKIVKGLMAHRKKGRWGNTQENAFVLLALDKYFNTYEKVTPDFVARVWLGDRYAGEHKFKGRTTEEHQIDIAMKYMPEKGDNLYIQKDGKGRMYYRIGMNYAPKSLWLDAADHGFVVQREYSGADNPDDVKRRPDGAWEVKAGAKVKIKLTMVAETRRYHVALVDPLPAGLESMNPAIGVTEDIPQDQAMNSGRSNAFSWWWWSRPWFEHQNMRDERTEAFTTLLWGGVHEYTYYARATTPGEFVVPPAKAEEMYSPETFGRSASDRVFVVDAK